MKRDMRNFKPKLESLELKALLSVPGYIIPPGTGPFLNGVKDHSHDQIIIEMRPGDPGWVVPSFVSPFAHPVRPWVMFYGHHVPRGPHGFFPHPFRPH